MKNGEITIDLKDIKRIQEDIMNILKMEKML